MSYDVSLLHLQTKEVLESSERFTEGGTYAIGGTSKCELNITYNYAQVFNGLVRELDAKTAQETHEDFLSFVDKWKDEPADPDYWKPTHGNAVRAIARLLFFATQHPSGIWEVS